MGGDEYVGTCGADERDVSVERREAGGVAVVETTAGPYTMLVFDVPEHRHAVIVGEEEMPRLARVLGVGRGGCVLGLEAYFARQDIFLTDLMDLLEREDIPYAYVAECEGRALFRP